jgi:hypothetical protein
LPDGIFAYQRSQFGYILEGLGIKKYFTIIWYTYFMAVWYIMWSLGMFFRFGTLHQEKSGSTQLVITCFGFRLTVDDSPSGPVSSGGGRIIVSPEANPINRLPYQEPNF